MTILVSVKVNGKHMQAILVFFFLMTESSTGPIIGSSGLVCCGPIQKLTMHRVTAGAGLAGDWHS